MFKDLYYVDISGKEEASSDTKLPEDRQLGQNGNVLYFKNNIQYGQL